MQSRQQKHFRRPFLWRSVARQRSGKLFRNVAEPQRTELTYLKILTLFPAKRWPAFLVEPHKRDLGPSRGSRSLPQVYRPASMDEVSDDAPKGRKSASKGGKESQEASEGATSVEVKEEDAPRRSSARTDKRALHQPTLLYITVANLQVVQRLKMARTHGDEPRPAAKLWALEESVDCRCVEITDSLILHGACACDLNKP